MQEGKYDGDDHPQKQENPSEIKIRVSFKYYEIDQKECSERNIKFNDI